MYRILSKRGGVETRLYVDPCTHKGCGPPFAPLTNPPNREDIEAIVFEFLRKHLKPGVQVPRRPRARVYVQGKQNWMDRKAWPPPDSRLSRLYLARTALTRRPPSKADSKRYLTNPADGLSMTFDQYGTVAASPYIPLDQRLAQEAGLTWRTPTLTRRMTLAGESALHLVAASSANDTDWFAKLSDVAPDGSESIVTAGFLRASHRRLDQSRSTRTRPWHPNTRPRRIEPGSYYGYDLAIWPTAYELDKGHRLQLRLTSYDFPTHLPGTIRVDPERPRNTWFTPLPPAANTVRLGGANPSYLLIRSLDRR
jgi:uncharacterized protein